VRRVGIGATPGDGAIMRRSIDTKFGKRGKAAAAEDGDAQACPPNALLKRCRRDEPGDNDIS
jgi:hypothetical protein